MAAAPHSPPPSSTPSSSPLAPLRRSPGFRWWLPLLLALVAGAIAFPLSDARTPVFQAEVILRAPDGGPRTPADYATLATADAVLTQIARELRLPLEPAALRQAIDLSLEGALIRLRVRATSADGAQRFAHALADATLAEATLAASSASFPGAPSLTLFRAPRAPTESVNDHRARDTAGAVAGGLLAGVLLAVLVAGRERPPRPALELEPALGWPTLAAIPRDRAAARPALRDHPASPAAAAYRLLARRLAAERRRVPFRALLVTGAEDGAGASTVALNLAFAFAAAGHHTLLVDTDLRPSPQRRSSPLTDQPGFAALLTNPTPLPPAPPLTIRENPRALPSGPAPADPATLFQPTRLTALLAQLTAGADLVILDAPSPARAPESAALAGVAGATIVVVAAHLADQEPLRNTARALREANAHLLGAVITKAEPGLVERLNLAALAWDGDAEPPPPLPPPPLSPPPLSR